MLLEKERTQVVEYCQKMLEAGLTRGTGGNISVFNPEQNLMAISPSGIEYPGMTPADVVVMDLEANIVCGSKKPSSEHAFHRIFYLRSENINAVVHTHSPFATTISCLRQEIPAVHYLVGFSGFTVPCAEYATFGTDKLAEIVYRDIGDGRCVLLANHGLIAIGKDIETAFTVAEEIEYVAEIYYRTKTMGEPVILDDAEMRIILDKFKVYGQKQGDK